MLKTRRRPQEHSAPAAFAAAGTTPRRHRIPLSAIIYDLLTNVLFPSPNDGFRPTRAGRFIRSAPQHQKPCHLLAGAHPAERSFLAETSPLGKPVPIHPNLSCVSAPATWPFSESSRCARRVRRTQVANRGTSCRFCTTSRASSAEWEKRTDVSRETLARVGAPAAQSGETTVRNIGSPSFTAVIFVQDGDPPPAMGRHTYRCFT